MNDYAFGNMITALRISRGFSQFQLGKLLGVSDKAVSKWENGNAKPRISTCYRLADILGVSLDELLSSGSKRKKAYDDSGSLPDMNEMADARVMGGKELNKREDLYPEKRVELHMRTNMSMSDGIVMVRDLSNRTLEWGMPAFAVTDFCSTRAFPYAASPYMRQPQKVIFGCEGFMIPSADASVESGCHIMLLARNREGLVNLNKLISLSFSNYYNGLPCMPEEVVERHRQGLLIGASCEDGEIFRLIRENASQEILNKRLRFYDYFEVQPVENELLAGEAEGSEHQSTLESEIRFIIRLGCDCGKPVVAVSNGRYLDPEDGLGRAVLQYNDGLENAEFQPPYYLRTTSEMLEAFSFLDEETAAEIVIYASRSIADLVEDQIALFPAGTTPDEPALPVIEGAEIRIRGLAMGKAHQLYGERLPDLISSRLDKEFSIISAQNAWSTLEIARLAVERSMQYGYPVGSRGGVGASLVAYFAGISRINPLPPHYNCPGCHFTLFAAPSGSDSGIDLPDKACPHCRMKMHRDGYSIPVETFLGLDGKRQMDIDLNFSSEIQENVHEYIRSCFGADRVFRPGTISGLADSRAKKYASQYAADHHMNADANDLKHASDQIIFAIRNTGQHSGGLFIIPESYDVNDFTPVQYPADSSGAFQTSHYDFNSMHDRLLKMDFIGHNTPTLLMLMGQKSGVSPDEIPLNDPGVLSLFLSPDALGVNERDALSHTGTVGIPEFGNHMVQDILQIIHPTTVEDLIRVSGLSHGTDVWTGNVKNLIQNQIAAVYDCPATRDDITNYLVRHGVAFDSAFTISEFVRKGKGSKDGLKPEMKEILKHAGIPEWYIRSCEQIRYLFPRAHAASYTADSLRIAWYKLYHPEAYYSAWFRVYGENLEPADLTMDITHLRKAILSIRMDLQDCTDDLFYEERQQKMDRETALLLLLEMKLRGYRLPDNCFQTELTD